MSREDPIPSRRRRLPIPDDVRKAIIELGSTHTSNEKIARLLGVAETTVHELISVGGVVQPKTLAKVRAKLDELKKGAA